MNTRDTPDVIVVGLGAMGSAAAYHLSKRGLRVLGIDQFHPPHDLGSSHGRTRIIREAYFEHPLYVPLVQRAYQLWAQLEAESRQTLFRQTGGLMIGRNDSVLVQGSLTSARQHNLPHEVLSHDVLTSRFPALNPPPDMTAIWESRAGILFPERAIATHLELAARHGAVLKTGEKVLHWEIRKGSARVRTAGGLHEAKSLLFCSGPWLRALVPDLSLPLEIERQVLYWFRPRAHARRFEPNHCPIHLWELAPGNFFYGFPDLGDGVKVAFHHQGAPNAPDSLDRVVTAEETEHMRRTLEKFIPDAAGELLSAAVCMYTNTPDEHFILDQHPTHENVWIASPCSGHGFKFSPVIGEICAQLISQSESPFDLTPFRVERFGIS